MRVSVLVIPGYAICYKRKARIFELGGTVDRNVHELLKTHLLELLSLVRYCILLYIYEETKRNEEQFENYRSCILPANG